MLFRSGPGMDDEMRSSAAAAAIDPHLHEFTVSLQNLLAALRRCSAVEIPCASMAAEAARSCNFEARFQDACTCMEQLCGEMLHATGVAARDCDRGACSSHAKSPDSADGRRYTPRRDPDGLFKALLEYVSISIDVFRARRGLFELRTDMDEAAALNHEALADLGQLFGASVYPACTRPQLEQLLVRMDAQNHVYAIGGGRDPKLAADVALLHVHWREMYRRASNRKRYCARARGASSQEPGTDSAPHEAGADFAAEAAMLAPPAAAATLATAVAVHGSGADKTLDHAAVATASPQSFPAAAADAGTPQTQGLPAAAVAAPPSPRSDSYSYYNSYSEDVEPAPAAAGASTRTWPAVQKKICKRSTATAVRGRARGCGRDPRADRKSTRLNSSHSSVSRMPSSA